MSESFGIYFYLEPSYSLIVFLFFVSLPDLLSEIKLTVGEISRDLTELVHTFRSVTIRLPSRCQAILSVKNQAKHVIIGAPHLMCHPKPLHENVII